MTNIFTQFLQKFNPFRDISKYFDIYEAYTIFNGNKLLKNNLIFFEKLVENSVIFTWNTGENSKGNCKAPA